jgi:hypothetical protein
MRQAILLLTLLATACGGGGDETAGGDTRAAVQTTDLTGLYEGAGEGEQRHRMCMISDPSGGAEFGVVVETPTGSCSGAGRAVRSENALRLTMAGGEVCGIEARLEGTRVTFPSTVFERCAYYCAPGATLSGAMFDKTGGTDQDAMRASDLAGDPLCR